MMERRVCRAGAVVRLVFPLFTIVLCAAALNAEEGDFTGATLRIDYYHTGTSTEEHVALDRVRVEGLWPGSRTQRIDDTNLGKYLVEVVDAETNRLMYSRGFASIYGEWETTGEARSGKWRAIPEALRIPEPRRPIQLRLRKRGSDGSFREIWSTRIDPGSRFVDRAPPPEQKVWIVQEHGDPSVKVDLLVLGDGYTEEQMDKFHADVKRLTGALFDIEPFASRRDDFNVRAIDSPAQHTGISRPRAGIFRETPIGTRYNSFDSERYVLTLNDRGWRDLAAAAPYEAVLILVNERKYGGGGIFNLYSTAAADSALAPYLVVHEFGHHFAGLGDEYYTSPVAYEEPESERREPWEPNITALRDPQQLKWKDLVPAGVPLPTPWGKQEFEDRSRVFQAQRAELRAAGAPEEQLETLFFDEREHFTATLGAEEHAGAVGAFEGAMYEARGYYRPSADCLMFTRDEVGFCSVCRRAIDRVIDLYAR